MKWILYGIAGLAMFTLFAFAFGWLAMWLWNWLVPELFHGPVVDYWQMVGLLVLSRMLFGFGKGGGCHHHGHGGKSWKHKWNHGGHWRKRMEEKMSKMSPEERVKFREKMKKCGWYYDEEIQPEQKPEEQNNNTSNS